MGRKLQPGLDKIGEDWVKKEVKAILKCFRLKSWMPSASMYGRSGQHDFIICQRSLCWTIETKADGNKVTDNQVAFAEDIQDAGGLSVVVDEFTLHKAIKIAVYIDTFGRLPLFWNDNFSEYL